MIPTGKVRVAGTIVSTSATKKSFQIATPFKITIAARAGRISGSTTLQ